MNLLLPRKALLSPFLGEFFHFMVYWMMASILKQSRLKGLWHKRSKILKLANNSPSLTKEIMTVMVSGYLIFLGIGFYDFISP